MNAPNFNEFLHELRGQELRRMPPGAETFLSAGCAGGWYFRWIAENYPGIRRHIGVEAYSQKPSDLPDNAEWISNSVSDMRQVPGESVDLLFSGQNVEHLAVTEIGKFLSEARRILRPGGWFVMDSPNRAITERLGWFQPEHVVEFRVDEIKELVELAGFDVESIRGLWQCYDAAQHRVLDLDPTADKAANRRRADAGEMDPENAFVWWLTARRAERSGDWPAVEQRVARIAAQAFPTLSTRFKTQVGTVTYGPLMAEACSEKGAEGYLLYGPYVPLFPGRYHAEFRIRAAETPSVIAQMTGMKLGHVDITSFYQRRELAMRNFSAVDLASRGADRYCSLPFEFQLQDAIFGLEFRVYTTGRVALGVAVPVQLNRIA